MKDTSNMNRRAFLRNSAALAGAAGLATLPGASLLASDRKNTPVADAVENFPHFDFNAQGKFKVLQITDTHYVHGNPKSQRALQNVIEMIETERPDLIIHTGDVIFGKPAKESLLEILAPLSNSGIPFAVTLGNHDEEYGMTRREVMDLIRGLPGCINTPDKGLYGTSNDIITLGGSTERPDRVLYLFDSNSYIRVEGLKGYDYIHFDQIDWYRTHSKAYTATNNGKPIPSMAFFHIPVPEFSYAIVNDTKRIIKGNIGEPPGCAKVNSGLFVNMKELGDVEAIVCGHEHDNDYAMTWNGMFLIYGRYSGCDTVYNNLLPNGARVFEFTKGQSSWRSWVRLNGGKIEQDLLFPDDFATRQL